MCRSRRELVQIFIFQSLPMSLFSISFRTDSYSDEYLLAKFGIDTAENEPCKVFPLSVYRSPRLLDCADDISEHGRAFLEPMQKI